MDVEVDSDSDADAGAEVEVEADAEAVNSVISNTPPELGTRDTSPRLVEKVWRSSWAYWIL